jgi:glycosyltransferase involved in cell wall biosynthesis
MQITVVITTHDRPELLREAIASVEAQRFDEWDVIVVDDGSCPAVTLNPMQRRIRLLRNEAAQGPSEARNMGMRPATGETIFFLDDDDLLGADALARINAAFQGDASLNCLFVNVESFGSEAEGTRHNQMRAVTRVHATMGERLEDAEHVFPNPSDLLFAALLERIPMAFQRVAIKRAQLQKVGLYRGQGFEDLE